MRLRLLVVSMLCLGIALPLAAPAGAARNLTNFDTVFPKASKLCQKADAGTLPKRLKASKAKVVAACAKLRQSYSDALNAYDAAAGPLVRQAKNELRGLREICRRDRVGCRAARLAAREKIKALRQQIAGFAATFRAANQKARKAFWGTIAKLPGGGAISPDRSVDGAPADGTPPDSEIESAG